jgi:putative two-component system response regulator
MIDLSVTASNILIIDDEEPNIRLLEFMLQSAGYKNVRGVSDPRRAVVACQEHTPDLILLDLHMPHISGLPLMKLLLEEFADHTYFPILVLTADLTPEAKRKALATGAKDFLPKPFDAAELLLRIRNLLATRALYKQIQLQNGQLTSRVEEGTRALANAEVEILERLARAAEYRDDETGQHTQRVGMLAAMIAEAAGQSADEVQLLRIAAPLHDVGKIGIPDRVLLKPGKLTPEELNIIRSHTAIGGEILAGSRFPVLQLARQIAVCHHERWDGTGYPQQISGESIPVAARVTAIADVFDALTHARPYKEAWPLERAIATIKHESGQHFDPALVSAFVSVVGANGLQALVSRLQAEPRPEITVNHGGAGAFTPTTDEMAIR